MSRVYRTEGGFNLGEWVSSRRYARRAGHGTPTADQIEQLDRRGFDWAPKRSGSNKQALQAFDVGLAHLDAFIAEHGHANVARRYVCDDGFALGSWVQTRRKYRRAGRPTPTAEQIRRLDERGFVWDVRPIRP